MEYTEKESQYLKKLSIWNRTTAEIRLTKTMLDKCIIDANTSVRTLAMLYGVNYDDMKNGEKIEVLAHFNLEKLQIVPCENGVGEWEISPTHETFDTRKEAEDVLKKHNQQETVVRFYKTINRGDRRVSIGKIKKFAKIGDLIGLTTLSSAESNYPNQILLINITKGADNE